LPAQVICGVGWCSETRLSYWYV